jgi:uncharacterized protein (TIGR03066 family)
MRSRCFVAILVATGMFAAVGSQNADDKKNSERTREKLIGVWELSGDGKASATTEFTKDGKMKRTLRRGNDKPVVEEINYDVDGNNLHVIYTDKDGKESKETITIAKLTDKELVLEKSKGQVLKFTRK